MIYTASGHTAARNTAVSGHTATWQRTKRTPSKRNCNSSKQQQLCKSFFCPNFESTRCSKHSLMVSHLMQPQHWLVSINSCQRPCPPHAEQQSGPCQGSSPCGTYFSPCGKPCCRRTPWSFSVAQRLSGPFSWCSCSGAASLKQVSSANFSGTIWTQPSQPSSFG